MVMTLGMVMMPTVALGLNVATAQPSMQRVHQKPFCIGVGGATASGKSSVVEEIVRLLDHEDVASITQDCFYRNLLPSEREAAYRNDFNFDHPDALDFDHQRRVLDDIRSGAERVAIPSYDFVTHSRLPPEHDQHICKPEIVIFEGILALYDERMRSQFDIKIFVDVDADVRLARRIRRDMESRGRDLAGILQQYEQFVKPSTEQFVEPTKRHADIIVPRGLDNVVAIELVAQHINGVLMQRELQAEALSRTRVQTRQGA
jgi:uridine kinase